MRVDVSINELIETIKSMKYMKIKKLNTGSWDKMLQGILDTIGQPIQIYNINITKEEIKRKYCEIIGNDKRPNEILIDAKNILFAYEKEINSVADSSNHVIK